MRILLSCLQSLRPHPIPAYEFWRGYFVEGLREAGHEVVEVPGVDWAEGLVHPPGDAREAWRRRTWETVCEFARREHAIRPLHMFLSYLYPQQIEISAVEELRRRGVPCVNFFCDNVRELQEFPAAFRPFDLHWVPEFEALGLYREAGAAHIHAPMPCWIPKHLRDLPVAETEPPSFIGSADNLRHALFGNAIAAGADLNIYGAGWTASTVPQESTPQASLGRKILNQVDIAREQGVAALATKLRNRVQPVSAPLVPEGRIKGPVSAAEYIRITREARVIIGVNRVPTLKAPDRRPLTYSRLRDIEAPMLGACYLTEWTAGIEHLYEPEQEVETYRTAEEMAEKLRRLSQDTQHRHGMRRRAQARALSEHSIPRTMMRIEDALR